jgi:hypothetical protein
VAAALFAVPLVGTRRHAVEESLLQSITPAKPDESIAL